MPVGIISKLIEVIGENKFEIDKIRRRIMLLK